MDFEIKTKEETDFSGLPLCIYTAGPELLYVLRGNPGRRPFKQQAGEAEQTIPRSAEGFPGGKPEAGGAEWLKG